MYILLSERPSCSESRESNRSYQREGGRWPSKGDVKIYQSVHSLAIEETGINRFNFLCRHVWKDGVFLTLLFISKCYDLTSIDHLSLSFHPNRKIAASRIVSIIHIPLVFAMGGGGWIIRRLFFEYFRITIPVGGRIGTIQHHMAQTNANHSSHNNQIG